MNLEKYGWNTNLKNNFGPFGEQGLIPARICIEHKNIYRIYTTYGELTGEISGKLKYIARNSQDYPAVGDWVAIADRPQDEKAIIHGILPRITKFSRKVSGVETQEQVVATNFDTVFIVNSLNKNFNIRRIERYLVMAWESGAVPVIVLSKADLCDNILKMVKEVESVAMGVPIHAISSLNGTGMEELQTYLTAGKTVAVLGSSGVGKSTLINRLAGEKILEVQEVRQEDDKGKHTTTHRQLVLLPSGGLIIDTPGMRELQLWRGSEGFHETFGDIEELQKRCKFKDCRHQTEPGCAIHEAIKAGFLSRERLEHYRKLKKEISYLERKHSQLEKMEEKKKKKQGKQSQLEIRKQKRNKN